MVVLFRLLTVLAALGVSHQVSAELRVVAGKCEKWSEFSDG
jgi:hypothetical protein